MNTVLLTAIEVASILRVSKAHSYKLIKSGDIPSVRFGRTVRVRQDDLDAFIYKNTSAHDEHRTTADLPVLQENNALMT
jgi:excisionase family DNA binding protein